MFRIKSTIPILLSVLLIVCTTMVNFNASAEETSDHFSAIQSLIPYSEYKENNDILTTPDGNVVIDVLNPVEFSKNAFCSPNIHDLKKDSFLIPDDGYASWDFTVDNDCAYMLRITYVAAKKSSGNLELEFELDGNTPFKEVSLISMRRIFSQGSEEFETNVVGNDILPTNIEELKWQNYDVSDSSGYTSTPFIFSLKKGTHNLKLIGSRGDIAIGSIQFLPMEQIISYSEYSNSYKDRAKADTQTLVIEGEKYTYKNSATVLPQTDRTSPTTYPQSASSLKLNTIGANSWKTIGDSITWQFEIEKSGMYEVALRYRQNLADGIFASRKLYIDNKLPFEEAASLQFDYSSDWQCQKIGKDDTVFSFWLEAGIHTITLEAVAGDVSDIVGEVDSALNTLNRIYRRIVMITGSSPDTNRDYNFKELIPNEINEMKTVKENLNQCIANIRKQSGASGSYTSLIEKLVFQLQKMTDNPRSIATYLEQFKSNLGAMSSWLLSAIEQPLEIDRIYLMTEGKETPKADANFFAKLAFSFKSFLASYTTDYSSIGQNDLSSGEKKEQLEVWIQSGRDQGEIIRDLMGNSYTKDNNVTVNLKIVPAGTLLQSVIAGISPDVVFDCGLTEPVDYALRGAVADLTKFDDYNTVFSRFSEASVLSARLNDGVYGMPQSFGFNMMFYRTDIFEEYGWKVPETWDELKELIPSLQYNGMEVGIPHDSSFYTLMLYQNGGELYKDGGRHTNLKSNTCLETFVDFCELFTLYDSPVTFDFANRFRTGEMPISIQNYTMYNQLIAFAPEIKGLWQMVPIPGTKDENGKINNVSVGTSTYIMLLENSKHKQAAWEFMKWFMSTDIQSAYSLRMESLLGSCAKVNSANIESLSKMAWSSSEYKNLSAQLNDVDSIPQVPGGYYLDRVISFAFNRTYNGSSEQTMGEDPAEVLSQYIKEFDEEIAHKREEFSEVLSDEN